MLMKKKSMQLLVIMILLGVPVTLFAQADYWAGLVYFGGCNVNHIPKGITIPDRNVKARAVMNAIIAGKDYGELRQQVPDSLDEILDRLSKGNVIRMEHEKIKILVPVLTAEKRSKMDTLIRQTLMEKSLVIDSLIIPLREQLKEHPRMVFHFLWSRVIDNCWWKLYNSEFHTKKGPPSLAWIIYPPHPFQCGTNYDQTKNNSQIAISWSYGIFDEFLSLPPTASFYSLVKNEPIPAGDQEFFLKYGLMDKNRVSQLFTYEEGGPLDLLCDSLKSVYIAKLKGMFNYRRLSKTFGIPAPDLFIIMGHETAYSIFQMLYEQKEGLYIPILPESNPEKNFSYLVSFRLRE